MDLISVFKYLMGRNKEDIARLFSVQPSKRKKGKN